MKINYFFILTFFATANMLQASQVEQKIASEVQRQATPLELKMIDEAASGTLTEAKLKQYLHAGAGINAKGNYGYTALILAARSGQTAITQQLITAGADLNYKNTLGNTALILATDTGHTEIAQQLIAAGADINTKNKLGDTALMWAVRNGHTAITQQLITANADLNAKNSDGDTALLWTAYHGHTAIAQQLIAAGANIEVKNNNGYTALIWAARNGHTDIVKRLIAAGTNPNICNEKDGNKTARDHARDKDAYDKAVAAGLAERKAHITKIIEEERHLIPVLSNIVTEYVVGPLDAPESKKQDKEKK